MVQSSFFMLNYTFLMIYYVAGNNGMLTNINMTEGLLIGRVRSIFYSRIYIYTYIYVYISYMHTTIKIHSLYTYIHITYVHMCIYNNRYTHISLSLNIYIYIIYIYIQWHTHIITHTYNHIYIIYKLFQKQLKKPLSETSFTAARNVKAPRRHLPLTTTWGSG